MTGWRVGWMVVPERLVGPSSGWPRTSTSRRRPSPRWRPSAPSTASDELEANKRVYAANRELLLAELPKAGIDKIVPADGAFYLYVDVSAFTGDSAFASEMLEEAGVAATPGVDFDGARGRRYVRFCYAGTPPTWPRRRAGSKAGSGLSTPETESCPLGEGPGPLLASQPPYPPLSDCTRRANLAFANSEE